jgi:hypothetical protein
MRPVSKSLRTSHGFPVRKLRPGQAAEIYGCSVDYLRDLPAEVTGRARLSVKLTVYDVACLEKHFAPHTPPQED